MVTMEMRPLEFDDIDALLDLHIRSQIHDSFPFAASRAELIEDWESEAFDPEKHSRVISVGDRLLAFGHIWHQPSGVQLERAYLWGHIDPEHRGSGLGRQIIEWQIGAARTELEKVDNDLPAFVFVDTYDWCDDRKRLYLAAGFEPVRYFEELLRPLDDIPAFRPIEGIEIVPFDPARSEDILEAKNVAFRDHWGSTPVSVDRWNEWLDSFSTRTDLSFVALENDRVVGVCINATFPEDAALSGRIDGWIESLSVVKEARGRGVASALIIKSLEAFKTAEFTHAALGVDSDSPTGADELYRRLGFIDHTKSTTYQIKL